jgi:hypothetical protein
MADSVPGVALQAWDMVTARAVCASLDIPDTHHNAVLADHASTDTAECVAAVRGAISRFIRYTEISTPMMHHAG